MDKRYFVEISFKGTNYHGWQIQPNAITVQETIEQAFYKIFQKSIPITGAGRTDTGVHARSYIFHFDTEISIDSKNFIYKLNRILPKDISVKKINLVNKSAHARFNALSRTYCYYINKRKDPFNDDFAAFFHYQIDIKLMNEAATRFKEFKYFETFSKKHSNVKSYDCNIFKSFWTETESQFVYTITANRFLRNMVRSIVGTLIDVGRKKISTNDFVKIIKSKDRSKASTSAPAKGLVLEKIIYKDDIYKNDV